MVLVLCSPLATGSGLPLSVGCFAELKANKKCWLYDALFKTKQLAVTTFFFLVPIHDPCSVQRRPFLMSGTNGSAFVHDRDHATVYSIFWPSFFPWSLFSCFACGAILLTVSPVSPSFLLILLGEIPLFLIKIWVVLPHLNRAFSDCFLFLWVSLVALLFPLSLHFHISSLSQFISSVFPIAENLSHRLPSSCLTLDW